MKIATKCKFIISMLACLHREVPYTGDTKQTHTKPKLWDEQDFPPFCLKLPKFTFRHRTLSFGKPAICMQSHLCFCLQNLWFEAHWNSFLKDKHKILNWHLNWKIFTFEWYPCFKIESYGISKISGTEICSNKKYEENNSAVTSIFKRNPCLTNWYLWQLLQAGLSFCNWNTTRAYCFHICLNIYLQYIFNEDSSFCSKSP